MRGATVNIRFTKGPKGGYGRGLLDKFGIVRCIFPFLHFLNGTHGHKFHGKY